MIRETSRRDSLFSADTPRELARFLLSRRGPLTSNIGEAHAFIRTEDQLTGPDIELIFAPVAFLDHGDTPADGHGYTIGVVLLQPESRGAIRLATSDPRDHPLIDPRYLSEPRDLAVLAAGTERAIEVFETAPLAPHMRGWIRPDRRPTSARDLESAVRHWSETLYHPAGTCRMGTDAHSVVDGELRVHGLDGLRVADASVIPVLNRGHTNAPTIMIGERAATLVAGS